jgi:hypothetical protein
LPNGFSGSLTCRFLAGGLAFVPWAGIKKIAAINTRDRFHIRHLKRFNKIDPLMVEENGLE